MTWNKLLLENRVVAEPTHKQEIENLRSIVSRCLSDMNVPGISDEQRFLIAYDAARTLAMIVVRASGYRPKKVGGHYNTFLGLAAADPAFAQLASYLDICRLKRNDSEYDFAGGISQVDADDLVQQVSAFQTTVHAWIASNFPSLM
jgi:hypothetical protein